jgi:hypothetical protein
MTPAHPRVDARAEPQEPAMVAGDIIYTDGIGEATESVAGRPGNPGRPQVLAFLTKERMSSTPVLVQYSLKSRSTRTVQG